MIDMSALVAFAPVQEQFQIADQSTWCADTASMAICQQAQDTGSVGVSQDITPIRNQFLVFGGETSHQNRGLGATLRASEREGIEVTQLRIQVNDASRSVDRVEIWLPGHNVPVGYATLGATGTDPMPSDVNGLPVTTFTARFTAGQIVIPKGQQQTLYFVPRIKEEASANSGASGTQIQLFMLPGDVSARGVQTHVSADVNQSSTISGAIHTVVGSKIVRITNANPDADGTSVPTGISDIGQWKFESASNVGSYQNGLNKVVLERLTFKVQLGNVSARAEDFVFYNKSNSTVRVHGYVHDGSSNSLSGAVTGTIYVSFNDLSASSINVRLDGGTSQTFVLQGSILNPDLNSASESSLQATLVTGEHQFRWIDRDHGEANTYDRLDLGDTQYKSTAYGSRSTVVDPVLPVCPPITPVVEKKPLPIPTLPTFTVQPPLVQTPEAPVFVFPQMPTMPTPPWMPEEILRNLPLEVQQQIRENEKQVAIGLERIAFAQSINMAPGWVEEQEALGQTRKQMIETIAGWQAQEEEPPVATRPTLTVMEETFTENFPSVNGDHIPSTMLGESGDDQQQDMWADGQFDLLALLQILEQENKTKKALFGA